MISISADGYRQRDDFKCNGVLWWISAIWREAEPDKIKRELKMSKNAFKRALGHLLKEGKIEIGENRIEYRKEK